MSPNSCEEQMGHRPVLSRGLADAGGWREPDSELGVYKFEKVGAVQELPIGVLVRDMVDDHYFHEENVPFFPCCFLTRSSSREVRTRVPFFL